MALSLPTSSVYDSEVCSVSDDDLQAVQPTLGHTEVEPDRRKKVRCTHHALHGVHE